VRTPQAVRLLLEEVKARKPKKLSEQELKHQEAFRKWEERGRKIMAEADNLLCLGDNTAARILLKEYRRSMPRRKRGQQRRDRLNIGAARVALVNLLLVEACKGLTEEKKDKLIEAVIKNRIPPELEPN